MNPVNQLTELRQVIDTLTSHEDAIKRKSTGRDLGLTPDKVCLLFLHLLDKAKELGINQQGMLALMYMHGKEQVSMNELVTAGLLPKGRAFSSMFRHSSVDGNDLVATANSGSKEVGKYFMLSRKGKLLAGQLAMAIDPDLATRKKRTK